MITGATPIRIARPSKDLVAAQRFYVDGLGLTIQWQNADPEPGEHALLMVGPSDGGWHFELTRDPENPLDPTPTVDDLFVVYLGAPITDEQVDRLVDAGGTRVPAHNPYWDTYGVTVADPDSYSLVLCERTWEP